DGEASLFERPECLCTPVVHEMPADVQQSIAVAKLGNHVPVPDLLKERLRAHSSASFPARCSPELPPAHAVGGLEFWQPSPSTSRIAVSPINCAPGAPRRCCRQDHGRKICSQPFMAQVPEQE